MIDATKPTLQEPACLLRRGALRRRQVKDPARLEWHEACPPKHRRRRVTKVAHYYLPACAGLGTADRSVTALSACGSPAQAGMTRPTRPSEPRRRRVQAREDEAPYNESGDNRP